MRGRGDQSSLNFLEKKTSGWNVRGIRQISTAAQQPAAQSIPVLLQPVPYANRSAIRRLQSARSLESAKSIFRVPPLATRVGADALPAAWRFPAGWQSISPIPVIARIE